MEYRITELETQEQDLLQHIRTSGLKKTRESFLVEKVLDTRKYRRQLVHDLMNTVASSSQENIQLKEELIRAKPIAESVRLKDLEISTLKEQYEATQLQVKDLLERMQGKYQSKLVKLEEKLRVLEGGRTAADDAQLHMQMAEFKAKLEAELHDSYNLKVDRYKAALVKLSEHEKELQMKVSQLETWKESSIRDHRSMAERLDKAEKHNMELKPKVEQLNELIVEFKDKVRIRDQKLDKLQKKLDEQQHCHNEAMNHLQSHQLEEQRIELEKIDMKIRKLLDHKDAIISKLHNAIKNVETEKAGLEASLADLNRRLG